MKIRRPIKFALFYRSVKTNLVSRGVSRNWCEIGSRSIGSFEVILKLWIIWAAKVKYSISASRFPTQFRFPKEKGQTFSFFFSYLTKLIHYILNCDKKGILFKYAWNWLFSKKRSGLNSSGSGKSFGLCITAKRDAITTDPFFINVPSTFVSWMHKWGKESVTGRNLKFSSKTALKYGHWSTMNFPYLEEHWSISS